MTAPPNPPSVSCEWCETFAPDDEDTGWIILVFQEGADLEDIRVFCSPDCLIAAL